MHDLILKRKVDIIIGTQLVTKGHDFPGITLVGVILSDLSLNIPDFRASERTFQLLTQVAGRAGRGQKSGEVLIQTYNPQHHSLFCAQKHDTSKFREIELELRKKLEMPPFNSLTLILCSSPNEDRAEILAKSLYEKINQFCKKIFNNKVDKSTNNSRKNFNVKFIGPMEAPIKKLRNRFRWQIILKAENTTSLLYFLNQVFKSGFQKKKEELIQIDVDPHNLL